MAIKNYDPSTNSLSRVRVNANQELNAFDFTNVYLNRNHFITEQDRYPDLVDKIWTFLREGTTYTDVRVHHVLVYEQVMEGNPYKVLTLKLLAVVDSVEGRFYRLYNINRETDFDIDDYIDIKFDEKDIIPSDVFKKLESHGIALALELTKENKYVLSLINSHDSVGFKVGYTVTRDKSGITVKTDLKAYRRGDESETVNVNDVIQGFCTMSDAYTGVVNAAAFSQTLADEVTKGILFLIYGLFNTYTEVSYITIGTEVDGKSNYVSFYIGYNVEETLEKVNLGSGKIAINNTGYKKISFSVDRRDKKPFLDMIKNFEALRDRLVVNKYGYNPAKLNRDIEEKIVKDFTNIVDVVSAYRLL
jgi:hypothetical protein